MTKTMEDDMDMDYSSDDDVEMPEQLSEMFARTLKSDEEEVIEADLGEATIIKQFTVDSSCKDEVVTLQLSLPSQDIQFQVCHLRPGKVEQFHTEIVLEETAVLSIVRGKGPVHVIGNVVISTNLAEFGESDDEDLESDEEEDESAEEGELPRIEDITGKDEEDEDEEAPKLVKASAKRTPSTASGKAKKAKVQAEEEDESEDEEDEEEDEEEESEDEDLEEDEDVDVQTRVKQAVTKASRQKKQQQQQKKSAPATPAKKNGTKSATTTPAKKAKGKEGDVSMDDMLKKVLASPNKPKKQAKFKNFCKNLFKLQDREDVLDELWQKYSASISK